MKVSVSKDKKHVELIRSKLRANDGYCPCALVRTADTKCMCKDFLENVEAGQICHCGLYLKEEK